MDADNSPPATVGRSGQNTPKSRVSGPERDGTANAAQSPRSPRYDRPATVGQRRFIDALAAAYGLSLVALERNCRHHCDCDLMWMSQADAQKLTRMLQQTEGAIPEPEKPQRGTMRPIHKGTSRM